MPDTTITTILKVLSNERRLLIVEWLKDPVSHFPPQRDGDLVEDGVCVGFITKKLKISQPSATTHMQALEAIGIVTSSQIKNWVFYKLNTEQVTRFITLLSAKLET